MTKTRIAAAGLAVLLAAPALAADIHGTVKLSGPPPKAQPIPTTKDQTVCGPSVADESILVSNGKLKNVVLTVQGAPKPPPGTEPVRVTIDQSKCHYVPHVQAASVGTPVDILNSDPVLHNIHSYLGTSTVFNLAMPFKGQKIAKTLAKPGLVNVKCDVHSWMHAYVVVTDAPFAVTGEDGAFTIRGVPPGTYTITAWHEKLGEKTAQVAVPASGEVAVDFTFGG
jgi:plastocyanin